MKTVCLIRHAKSGQKDDPTVEDFDRGLIERGLNDASWCGRRLNESAIEPQVLVSSPAKRALKTAQLVAKQISYPPEEIVTDRMIYDGNTQDILAVINKSDEKYERIALFGHNPSISSLLKYLSEREVEEMKTAAIACLQFDVNAWKEITGKKGKVTFFDAPPKKNK